jgi:hypothetical protein
MYFFPEDWFVKSLLSVLLLALAEPVGAQLAGARAVAHTIPGELPTSNPVPVFQVRFPRGWIMVDAGMDRETARRAGDKGVFLDEAYTSAVTALRARA